MRKIATFAATVMLGSGMAVLGGGTAAQAAQSSVFRPRTPCYTTMPVTPRRPPAQYRPDPLCGRHTNRGYILWLHFGR